MVEYVGFLQIISHSISYEINTLPSNKAVTAVIKNTKLRNICII
jgi:hypothetical protein